jgi:hypothetical protein
MTDFHSLVWTLVRNKKGKERQEISKSDLGSSTWHRILHEEVSFVAAPKEFEMTYQTQEIQERLHQPSLKMTSAEGNGKKKPGKAINMISNKKLDVLLKKMLANDAALSESGARIDQTIDELQT